jgi:dienelactone hydrolase
MYRKLIVALACITLAIPALHAQTDAPAAQRPSAATPAEPLTDDAPTTTSTPAPAKEDWTTISLAKSGLPSHATGAVLLSKIEKPGCTRELLRVQWRRGDPIDLYVIRPRSVAKPPVILFLYNYTFDTDIFRADRWCEQVKQNGYAAVGFASALSWQRFHSPRPMKQWFVSELQEALSTSTHDVQMVLNYLDTRNDLDMNHVGMFGQGSGGAIAILSAAADPRIVALDLIDAWGDWPDWLHASKQIPEEERAAYLKPEFLQQVSNLDPISYLPQLKVKALRIQQAADDPITPPAAKNKIAAAAPRPNEVIRYQDRMAAEKAWTTGGLSAWLGEQLRVPAEASADRVAQLP